MKQHNDQPTTNSISRLACFSDQRVPGQRKIFICWQPFWEAFRPVPEFVKEV